MIEDGNRHANNTGKFQRQGLKALQVRKEPKHIPRYSPWVRGAIEVDLECPQLRGIILLEERTPFLFVKRLTPVLRCERRPGRVGGKIKLKMHQEFEDLMIAPKDLPEVPYVSRKSGGGRCRVYRMIGTFGRCVEDNRTKGEGSAIRRDSMASLRDGFPRIFGARMVCGVDFVDNLVQDFKG